MTAASPVGFSPRSVSSVIRAVVIAKSRCSSAFLSFLRPKRTSVRPKPTLGRGVDRAAHLARDLREAGEPLFERRMVHEELGGPRLDARGDDEEGIHARD